MRNIWSFYSAGELIFGWGAAKQTGNLIARRNLRRVLIITDQILEQAGIVDRIRGSLESRKLHVGIFDEGEPEPSLAAARKAFEVARNFQPEIILGVGGGSNMDLAKMTAVLFTHGGPVDSWFGFNNVPGPVTPVGCIPTTAGTGSEVSHAAVLTDTENQIKVSTLSPHLRPALAIVDPELTLSCPPKVTADSGIDALTHAIEALTATDFHDLKIPDSEPTAYSGRNPLGDCLAEKAIELVGQHLVTAVRKPDNRAAREGMSLAATLAGLAFSNCAVAVVHALEYPLGGELHCSHGAGNGMLLPYVMRFNLPVRVPQFARIAALLGEKTVGLSTEAAAEKAIDAVERLRKQIGIPERIRDLGGKEAQLPAFAKKSFQIKRLMEMNPRKPTEEDLLRILQDAF